MPAPARILWTNAVTLGSVAVLVGTELVGAGGAAGWAIGGLFQLGDMLTHVLEGLLDPVRADGALFLPARRARARADPGLRGPRRSLRRGGAMGDPMSPLFQWVMARDEGLFSRNHGWTLSNPLPPSGERGLADASLVTSGAFPYKLRPDCANLRDAWSPISGLTSE